MLLYYGYNIPEFWSGAKKVSFSNRGHILLYYIVVMIMILILYTACIYIYIY